MTQSTIVRLVALLLLASASAGCQVIGGIFRAGFWTGIVFAILIVVGVMMLFRRR